MKRAVLIKMTNGRHRVATSYELKQREKIKAISIESDAHRARAFAVSQQVARAREDGATQALRSKYLEYATERVIRELTDKYGPELMKAAEKLKRSDYNRGSKWIDLTASFDLKDVRIIRVRGEIPAIRYEVAVSDW